MNFKTMAFSAVALLSLEAHSAFLEPIYKYHHSSGKVVELQNINTQKGSAYYFDYALGKRIEVSLSDVSRETKERINGVKAGDFVAAGNTVCTTYNVFENGMAYLGCRTGKYMNHLGPSRFEVGGYLAPTEELTLEVAEIDGFKKGEKVLLGSKKVKIKGLFANGVALLESANPLAKIDTSSTLLKTNVLIVSTRDLGKR